MSSFALHVDVTPHAARVAAGGAVPVLLATLDEGDVSTALAAGASLGRSLGDPPTLRHLHVRSASVAAGLPGLGRGSRLADAVRVAFAAGAPAVDVLAVEGAPGDVARPDRLAALGELLERFPEALVAIPDAGRSERVSPADEAAGIVRIVDALAGPCRDRYQTLLLDLPPLEEELAVGVLRACLGADVALVGWDGSSRARAAHGWRSAAAALAGMLGSDADVAAPVLGRAVALPPGRHVVLSREEALSAFPAIADDSVDPARLCVLEFDRVGDVARVRSEPTFRRPVGAWPLVALRAAKALHRALVRCASDWVFRNATEAEAVALSAGLLRAIDPWTRRGMLTAGALDDGPPRVEARVEPGSGQWSMTATITGTLRPWSCAVRIRVALSTAGGPVAVEAA